ncbi:MAG TPA: hypothetical protein VNJ01_01405 [Bacteriovoracaceae bacterium]|nr:hypothetical protein [Bacteriovoracaceae bacterium]
MKVLKTVGTVVLSQFLLLSTGAWAETNVRVSPLGLLIGSADVEVDFKISPSVTLGPTFQFLSLDSEGFDVSAYSVGIRSNIFLNGEVFKSGWYVGPVAKYINVKVEDTDNSSSNLEGSASGLMVAVILGYQWMWESFNINLGVGPGHSFIDEIRVTDNAGYDETYEGSGGFVLPIEFMLGWKF